MLEGGGVGVIEGPRNSESRILLGGCVSLHQEPDVLPTPITSTYISRDFGRRT